MSDFVPPSGPPPPKVPEGWKAVWNDQYKEWFYVNLYTKQSQWDKPDTPAFDPNSSHAAPNDAPPSYGQGGHNAPVGAGIDSKSPNLHSSNPYSQNVAESDEAMARRLQEEENRRISADKARGASDSYYQSATNQGYPNAPDYGSQQQSQQQVSAGGNSSSSSGSRGFLSKIKDKMQQPSQRPMGAPMMGYNAGGYPPQQYGGYPQQGYAQQGYGRPMGGMPMGMGGGMMGGGYGQPVKRKGGLGTGGAAALGVGGGLLGGMMLMDGIDHMEDNAYDQGYDQGQGMDNGGGDMDGGDMGGGDF